MFNRFSFCFHLFLSLINARHQICHSSFLRVHSNSVSLVFVLWSASPLKVTIARRRKDWERSNMADEESDEECFNSEGFDVVRDLPAFLASV